MALRRTLSHRLSHVTKISSPTLNLTLTHSPFSSPSSKPVTIPPDSTKPNFFRRILQKRALVQSAMNNNYQNSFSEMMMEKLKGMSLTKDRLRLDGLLPLPVQEKKVESDTLSGISVEEAKKLLRLAQLEGLKSRLRRIQRSSIPYSEFLEICKESSSCADQGMEFAKMLDESGSVILIKETVFLFPEQVAKAIQGVIPLSIAQPNDPRRKELERMEKEKFAIDKKAEILVRRELWGGLGFLVFQTAGFIRLTFWELSWDVMEPICFYFTSFYFMASYAFFLRTSQEPTFEGFFQSRFRAKQKRLMKARKFDLERFNRLKGACDPGPSEGPFAYSMHH